MAGIKIRDLPRDRMVNADEMKSILGGRIEAPTQRDVSTTASRGHPVFAPPYIPVMPVASPDDLGSTSLLR